ncbi:hypothetical protein [Bradyrhizobium cajani]|uniref:Uncharacterized protein n=1 Tax=Bradyrhizobium cajani TaxID=1928661 RepID=A0A844TMW0_9BRAD|nr:hypothetical protein [Bradyrhizobium cajani]MCP3370786.1 hypothetical protein [Bradyrhizobium cajani]MVT75890.1 hypothetical protein [Bradyrhizobium cajani]
MSNVIAFPGCNLAPLGNPSFAYVRASTLPPESVSKLDLPPAGRRRSVASMHTYVFRSYDLILASSEADLVRDVGCDLHKAATKLNAIREQLRRDREHAAAREDLLTRAEARLAAALAAVLVKAAEG